jgi:hypothetical protein
MSVEVGGHKKSSSTLMRKAFPKRWAIFSFSSASRCFRTVSSTSFPLCLSSQEWWKTSSFSSHHHGGLNTGEQWVLIECCSCPSACQKNWSLLIRKNSFHILDLSLGFLLYLRVQPLEWCSCCKDLYKNLHLGGGCMTDFGKERNPYTDSGVSGDVTEGHMP